MSIKFIDKQPRSVLMEGRTKGIGFAFCKTIEGGVETVMPISACKDYLNDVVYSEATGKPWKAYGLDTTKQGIFDNGTALLAMSVLKEGPSLQRQYEAWDAEVKALKSNLEGIQEAINTIELLLKVDGRTQIQEIGENLYLCTIPLFWVKATYLISLWALSIRNLVGFKEGDPIDYLEKINSIDTYHLRAACVKLRKMIANGTPSQDMTNIAPHNMGIVSCTI